MTLYAASRRTLYYEGSLTFLAVAFPLRTQGRRERYQRRDGLSTGTHETGNVVLPVKTGRSSWTSTPETSALVASSFTGYEKSASLSNHRSNRLGSGSPKTLSWRGSKRSAPS